MPEGIHFEERWVPFPRSISDEARALMVAMVGPDGVPVKVRTSPEPDDFDGWVAHKEKVNAGMREIYRQYAPFLPATVETRTVDGVTVHIATPTNIETVDPSRVFLAFHGGALYAGGGDLSLIDTQLQAVRFGVTCWGVDYRTPPEDPYPAALDDGVAVYRALLADHDPGHIIVGGTSAGANLAAATVLRARDEGLPLPAAAVLPTPELDLTESGDSFTTNYLIDVVLPLPAMPANLLYAGGHDLADPLLSPLFADFSKGFPPTIVTAGTRDLLLSNAVRMQRALRRANVPVELHVFEGMPHGGFGGAPEDFEMAAELRRFVDEHWAQ